MSLLAAISQDFTDPNFGATFVSRYSNFKGITGTLIDVVFYGGLALALAFGIISGVKYATSGGDKMAAQAAKQGVTNAIIGFIIVIGFRTIIEVILRLVGVPTGEYTIPTTVPTW